ncbi:bifunctional demethylmenaquinone methyltransferase/2-methoxy-6-polyprenyl-1,4-benzoquinol methylase UbiE [bacterium]|nr:bifunctional demethylmenaquinone methyltransferase/2-methoxy-6-polyprenyl-1,4-benzoquinol methylase UbiE [bacterium]
MGNSEKLPYEKEESWKMFDGIAQSYDLLNTVLSMGIVQYWRKILVRYVPSKDKMTILDCATGTGEVMASIMKKRATHIEAMVGIDLSKEMMSQGKKSKWYTQHSNIAFKHASALDIPFNAKNFDVVSMAFGIRNVGDYKHCLKEIFRVIKPGGRALIMEFSLPSFFLLRWLYLGYFRWILPFIGGVFSGNATAYKYLNKTVETFPYGDAFLSEMKKAGFHSFSHKLTCGIATLYVGDKPAV